MFLIHDDVYLYSICIGSENSKLKQTEQTHRYINI